MVQLRVIGLVISATLIFAACGTANSSNYVAAYVYMPGSESGLTELEVVGSGFDQAIVPDGFFDFGISTRSSVADEVRGGRGQLLDVSGSSDAQLDGLVDAMESLGLTVEFFTGDQTGSFCERSDCLTVSERLGR